MVLCSAGKIEIYHDVIYFRDGHKLDLMYSTVLKKWNQIGGKLHSSDISFHQNNGSNEVLISFLFFFFFFALTLVSVKKASSTTVLSLIHSLKFVHIDQKQRESESNFTWKWVRSPVKELVLWIRLKWDWNEYIYTWLKRCGIPVLE